MGFLDKALKQGKDLLAKNADKVDMVIDKAGNVVDKKTHGKYAGTVNKVQVAAKQAAAKANTQNPRPPYPPVADTPPNPPTPPVPPTSPN